jgi:hypothetical protein
VTLRTFHRLEASILFLAAVALLYWFDWRLGTALLLENLATNRAHRAKEAA